MCFEPFPQVLEPMHNSPVKDRELLAAVADGNREAFRQLYVSSYSRLAHYVKSIVKDHGMAEDIIIQTYGVVWRSANSFRGDSRVITWMIGIARNLARKEFRRQHTNAPFDETCMGPDMKSQHRPEHESRKKTIQAALLALSHKHREVLEMAFYLGLTYPEIAKLVNIPVNTVKTRMHHAKKALRNELAKKGISEHDL